MRDIINKKEEVLDTDLTLALQETEKSKIMLRFQTEGQYDE